MDRRIFTDWWDSHFIPAVKRHQREQGTLGNVILSLDNGPSHPPAEELVREDGRFTVIYLCPRATALLQLEVFTKEFNMKMAIDLIA